MDPRTAASRGARSARLGTTAAAARAPSRKSGHRSEQWLRPITMAIIVAGEWLLLIADVFVRFYLI